MRGAVATAGLMWKRERADLREQIGVVDDKVTDDMDDVTFALQSPA